MATNTAGSGLVAEQRLTKCCGGKHTHAHTVGGGGRHRQGGEGGRNSQSSWMQLFFWFMPNLRLEQNLHEFRKSNRDIRSTGKKERYACVCAHAPRMSPKCPALVPTKSSKLLLANALRDAHTLFQSKPIFFLTHGSTFGTKAKGRVSQTVHKNSSVRDNNRRKYERPGRNEKAGAVSPPPRKIL